MAAFTPTINPPPELESATGPKSVVLVAPGTYPATAQQEMAIHGQGSALAITIHTPAGSAGTESTVPTVEHFDVAAQAWVVLLTGVAIVTARRSATRLPRSARAARQSGSCRANRR